MLRLPACHLDLQAFDKLGASLFGPVDINKVFATSGIDACINDNAVSDRLILVCRQVGVVHRVPDLPQLVVGYRLPKCVPGLYRSFVSSSG